MGFNFQISDLFSNDTTPSITNPFYREFYNGAPTSPLITSAAYGTTTAGGGQTYDSYAGTSMLSMSDVMMGTPIAGSPTAALNYQSTLTSALLTTGVAGNAKKNGTLGLFDTITPTDILTAAASTQNNNTTDPNTAGVGNSTAASGATGTGSSTANGPTTNAQPGGLPAGESMWPTSGVPVANFVNLALQQVGKAYIWGAAGPGAFDCCLVPESMIQTPNGPKMIKNILPGDIVYSWSEGKLVERMVIAAKMQGKQEVFEVRTRNRAVQGSANHPFLVAIKDKRKQKAKGTGRGWQKTNWRFEWKRLDTLNRGDLIITFEKDDEINNAPILPGGTLLTKDIAWLLGLIVADGHITSSGFNICVYNDLREQTLSIVKKVWGITGHPHKTHGIQFHSMAIKTLLESLGMKKLGLVKVVPQIIWEANNELKTSFLDGYWEGDGSEAKEKNGRSYHSASMQLVQEVRMLHIMLYDKVGNISINPRKKPIIIKGKLVKNAQPLYSFTMWPNSTRRMVAVMKNQKLRDFIPDEKFSAQKISEIKPIGIKETWDIEIEDSHNYIADGVLVHNSGLVMYCLQQLKITFPHYTGSQYAAIQAAGLTCSVEEASNVYGAVMFVASSAGPAGEHVAISLGDGKQLVEGLNPSYGVVKDGFRSGFDVAGFLPGLDYSAVTYGQGLSTFTIGSSTGSGKTITNN